MLHVSGLSRTIPVETVFASVRCYEKKLERREESSCRTGIPCGEADKRKGVKTLLSLPAGEAPAA
jgi:hypothetical protein